MSERSRIEQVVETLVRAHGPRVAKAALRRHLGECSTLELAAANFDWSLWARPAQVIEGSDWRSHGFCCGRGFGKTHAMVSYALQEIEAGRARRLVLVAQTEPRCIDILVRGFLELAPPWLGAAWEPSTNTLRFANGAEATVFGATDPKNIRGSNIDLILATEVSHWQTSTAIAVWKSLAKMARVGSAKIVWDTSPRRRDPLLRYLLDQHTKDPKRYRVVERSSADNRLNLNALAYAEMEAEADPQEFFGRPSNEVENALFTEADLDRSPRPQPPAYTERVISIDPSSSGKYSDAVGIVEAANFEGHVWVLANMSGKRKGPTWVDEVLDRYMASRCTAIRVETNHAGRGTWETLFAQACKLHGWRFNPLADNLPVPPRHVPGEVNFVPFAVPNTSNKYERAKGASNLIRAGRVSFVDGALGKLKEELADFTGEANRPDDQVDACCAAISYLLRFEAFDPGASIRGINRVQEELNAGASGALGRQPITPPRLGTTTRSVGGVNVRYDGSASLKGLFGAGGWGKDRI